MESQGRRLLELQACWREKCGMPPVLRGKSFDNFDWSRQRQAAAAVHRWATRFPVDAPVGYPSLLLYSVTGTYGVGKTHLLAAAANWVLSHYVPAIPDDAVCPIRYETGTGLVRRIRATYNVQEQDRSYHETEEMVYYSLSGVRLLILDDVREETASKHSREVYYHIINERVNSGLPLLLSANISPASSEFAEVVGGPVVSRLLGMTQGNYYKLSGKDYRLAKKQP